jgi:hypothetical protein
MPGLAVTLPLLPPLDQQQQQQQPETQPETQPLQQQLPGRPPQQQQGGVPLLCIKRTYQPNTQRTKRKHGFLRRCGQLSAQWRAQACVQAARAMQVWKAVCRPPAAPARAPPPTPGCRPRTGAEWSRGARPRAAGG